VASRGAQGLGAGGRGAHACVLVRRTPCSCAPRLIYSLLDLPACVLGACGWAAPGWVSPSFLPSSQPSRV